jgi:two-component system, LytTR family, response regulator
MLKAIIIDDDLRDKELLEMMLGKYCFNEISIIGIAQNIDSAYQLILETNPDIIFLDIELGNESGFDLLKKFTEYSFKVVFVTAYDKYAVTAIKFNALDYVLKPIVITELVNAVQKMKNAVSVSLDAELKNLIHTLAHPHQKSNKVAIPVLNGYKMIGVETILYCEAKKEYTNIYSSNQPPICSSVNLGEYEELLQAYSFCRVHHSFLVNKDHVIQYIKGEGGELMIDKEIMIPVSRRKKQEVMEWLTTKQ